MSRRDSVDYELAAVAGGLEDPEKAKQAKALIDKGADPDRAFYHACQGKAYVDKLHDLADLGAKPQQVRVAGETVLHAAVECGDHEMIDVLFNQFDVDALVAVQDPDGDTPLHKVTQQQPPIDESDVRRLVDAGAPVNARNNDGQTPLMFLAERVGLDAEPARILIEAGADSNLQNDDGFTAEDYADAAKRCTMDA